MSKTLYLKGKLQRLKEIRRFPINPGIPLLIILAFIIMAIFAPFIAPHSPLDGSLVARLRPPAFAGGSSEHLLGTDRFGRDVFSRIIYGSRVSLSVAVLAILVSATIGTLLGLVAGYKGGWVDSLIMRLVDTALSIPLILMAIVYAVVFGPSYQGVVLIIGLLLWPQFARQIRGEALSVKEQDYVAYARMSGCSPARIIVRHIFPNVVPTLLVLCTLTVGIVVLLEASLSFLGVGVPPPSPTWGGMVSDGRGLIVSAWWLCLFPGLAILFLVLSVNLFGDWVRDWLDPKLRQV